MNSRAWRPYPATVFLGAASLGVGPLLAGGGLGLRSALLLSILLFALQLFAAVKSLDRRAAGALLWWFGGSVALIVAIVAVGERLSLLAMAGPLAQLILAWAFGTIARQRAEHGRVLVFVRDASPDPTGPFFTAMYAYNLDGGFHGPVVVARDLGAADSQLVARYPGYVSFLLTNGSADLANGFDLVPLDR